MSRRVRAGLLAAVVSTSAVLLSACGGGPDSSSLGHQACLDVQRSLNDYDASLNAADPATRRQLAEKAQSELRQAVQPAALAGSADGSWQALEITLGESNRVNEGTLKTALEAQCAQTLGST